MAGTLISIDAAGIKYLLDSSTDTPKLLTMPAALTTTGLSLEVAGVDYTVTAGKTFYMLGYLITSSANGYTLSIYQSTAADGTTGEVDKVVTIIPISAALGSYTIWIPTPDRPSITAAKYVNAKVSSIAGGSNFLMSVIGYEA